MSWFATFETKVVIKTPSAFFWGEFFDADSIYIHGIWVLFLLGMVVILVVLEGEEWISLSFGNFVGLFPDMFKVKCLCVPFFHCVWDSVH